jgi:hypothetical protein
MMSGRAGFRNRVSASVAPGIPPRGTRAMLPNKKCENNPMHSRALERNQAIADFTKST